MADVLVVGGAGGVGLALVDKLVARGDRVIATVLDGAEASRVATRHGGSVDLHHVDLSDADAVLSRLRRILASCARLDAVAVCAAVGPNGPIETAPLADFRRVFEINCVADVAVYQAALPLLRKSKGRIVFISSTSGRIGLPFVGVYTASKYALEGVVDVMRREAAPQGVVVGLIEPGAIRTAMIEDGLSTIRARLAGLCDEDRARYGRLYRRFEALAGGSLASGASEAGDVADVVIEAFDATDPRARYVAGQAAERMLEMTSSMSDPELDDLLGRMFSEADADALAWGSPAQPGRS